MSSSKNILLVSRWNDGSGHARVASAHVTDWIQKGHNVVVLGPPRNVWVEDSNSVITTSTQTQFRYHEIGEDVVSKENEVVKRIPGMDMIDYITFQILFFSTAYEVDTVFILGGLSDSFEIIARLSLINDFTTDVRCILRQSHHVAYSPDGEIQEASLQAYKVAYTRFNTVYANCDVSQLYPNYIHYVQPVREHVATIIPSPKKGKQLLEERLGISLPINAVVFLVVNQTREVVDAVIRAYDACLKRNPDMAKDDASFLLIQQGQADVYIANLILALDSSHQIGYLHHPLPSSVLNDVYTACDIGVHFNCATAEHLQHYRRQIVRCTLKEVITFSNKRICETLCVPCFEELALQMAETYNSVLAHPDYIPPQEKSVRVPTIVL